MKRIIQSFTALFSLSMILFSACQSDEKSLDSEMNISTNYNVSNLENYSEYKDLTYKQYSSNLWGGVLPRVELLAGVLTQTSWIDHRGPQGDGNRYYRALKDFFSHYSDYPAIKIAEELTKNGFTYDAPLGFILTFDSINDMNNPHTYSEYLIDRADGSEILERFRIALINLANESEFVSFYENNIDEYTKWISRSINGFDGILVTNWLDNFFGWSGDQYNIVFAPAMFPSGGYGATIRKNNKDIYYQVIRESGITYSVPTFPSATSLVELSLHEFGHSYVNPSINEYSELIFELGIDKLYTIVENDMKKMAYGIPLTFFHESIIRAVTAIGMSELNNDMSILNSINEDEKLNNFYLQDFLVESLQTYQNEREKYPTFHKFIPVLLEKLYENMDDLIQNHQMGI